MSSTSHHSIPDIQSAHDDRNLPVDKVGVRRVLHPIRVEDEPGQIQSTVATFEMYVWLPAHCKGTHMSRFLEVLHEVPEPLFGLRQMPAWLDNVASRLEARSSYLSLSFPFFIEKSAPISGVRSLMSYQVTLSGSFEPEGTDITCKLHIPVTTLCPCSKKISAYGAHNQRSEVTISLTMNDASNLVTLKEAIRVVEEEASCDLYSILKRPDEKYVTERAYDNPKFVEDIVRDIAVRLKNDPRITHFSVASENFESIHDHSAYAYIEG